MSYNHDYLSPSIDNATADLNAAYERAKIKEQEKPKAQEENPPSPSVHKVSEGLLMCISYSRLSHKDMLNTNPSLSSMHLFPSPLVYPEEVCDHGPHALSCAPLH